MKQGDLMNLCFSCLIDGGGEHVPITLDEAAYTLQCWQDEGLAMDGLTPEAFMMAWNNVLRQLKGDNHHALYREGLG